MSVFDKNTRRVLSYDVLRPTAAENVVMTKGVVSGGGFDLRLQRITSSPSQTIIRPRLVRRTATDAAVRECSARRLPTFAALFFTLRDVRFTIL